MSFMKKSDVKNHLFTGAAGGVLPFRPGSEPDATGFSDNAAYGPEVNAPTVIQPNDGQRALINGATDEARGAAADDEEAAVLVRVKTSRP